MNTQLRANLNRAISAHLSAIANGTIEYTMMANGRACIESKNCQELQEACHFLAEAGCEVTNVQYDDELGMWYAHATLVVTA